VVPSKETDNSVLWTAKPSIPEPLSKEEEEKEKEKKQKRKIEEQKIAKQEEEYIKHKAEMKEGLLEKKQEEEHLSQTLNHGTCKCSINVVGSETVQKITKYTVEIVFANQHWTIFRRFKQFAELHEYMMRGTALRSKLSGLLPPKTLSKNDEPNFVEERRKKLNIFMNVLSQERPIIFGEKFYYYHFVKFLAPTQLGDNKESQFIMPFDLSPP